MPIDLNRANLSLDSVNVAINDVLEQVALRTVEEPRGYLGASIVGSPCVRKVQYDWWCKRAHPARLYEIFERGHYFEQRSREQLKAAGFKFAPDEALSFTTCDGLFRGHADGIIVDGPSLSGFSLNFPFIWEHKCVNAKRWREIERDGLNKASPQYAAQVAIYQAYLECTEPALFTIMNADTCERLHFFVPFDATFAQVWGDCVATILAATRADELLPRGFADPKDWHCRMCGHHERCWR